MIFFTLFACLFIDILKMFKDLDQTYLKDIAKDYMLLKGGLIE